MKSLSWSKSVKLLDVFRAAVSHYLAGQFLLFYRKNVKKCSIFIGISHRICPGVYFELTNAFIYAEMHTMCIFSA